MQIVKIREDFYIPIPKKILEKYNFLPHLEVALEEREDGPCPRMSFVKSVTAEPLTRWGHQRDSTACWYLPTTLGSVPSLSRIVMTC